MIQMAVSHSCQFLMLWTLLSEVWNDLDKQGDIAATSMQMS